MASSSILQQPPAYILQGWCRQQPDPHDRYLLAQKFPIAPDGAVPCSRIRQHIRNAYKERKQSIVPVHCEPWEIPHQVPTTITPTKDLVKNHVMI